MGRAARICLIRSDSLGMNDYNMKARYEMIEITVKGANGSGKTHALAILIPALNSAGFAVVSCRDGDITQEFSPDNDNAKLVKIKTELG